MPIFSYTFRDASGGTQKGTAEAESEEILRKRFEEQGFTITEVTMIKAKGAKPKRYPCSGIRARSTTCLSV